MDKRLTLLIAGCRLPVLIVTAWRNLEHEARRVLGQTGASVFFLFPGARRSTEHFAVSAPLQAQLQPPIRACIVETGYEK
jgi:hypothetical protein